MTPSFRWRSDRNTTQRGYAEVAPTEGLAHLRMAPREVHHMENKGFNINDLPQSGEVTLLAVVIEKELRPKRNGGSFLDRKSTRLNSSHLGISYAVFCLKKK